MDVSAARILLVLQCLIVRGGGGCTLMEISTIWHRDTLKMEQRVRW
jgi:hypothetical protein